MHRPVTATLWITLFVSRAWEKLVVPRLYITLECHDNENLAFNRCWKTLVVPRLYSVSVSQKLDNISGSQTLQC